MGLITKHGILIVQFANELQRARHDQARGDRAAAGGAPAPDPDDDRGDGARRGAAGDRLGRRRGGPLQHGPRASSTGLSIGTLFTLFVVPAFYMLLAADHHAEKREQAEAGLDDAALPQT